MKAAIDAYPLASEFTDQALQFAWFTGFAHRFSAGHIPVEHKVGQGFLQGLHALFSPRLDLGIELACFSLADQDGGGGCVDQDLLGHHPTELPLCRVLTPAKGLGEHSDQTA